MFESKCIIFPSFSNCHQSVSGCSCPETQGGSGLFLFLHSQALWLIPPLKYLSHLSASLFHQPGLSPQHAPGMPLFPPLPAPTLLKSIFQSSQKDLRNRGLTMSFPFKIRHQDPRTLAPYPWHPYSAWDVLGSSKVRTCAQD